ncbi:uncharacterized protein LOC144732929 isoform X4 [Lampetra planeri]
MSKASSSATATVTGRAIFNAEKQNVHRNHGGAGSSSSWLPSSAPASSAVAVDAGGKPADKQKQQERFLSLPSLTRFQIPKKSKERNGGLLRPVSTTSREFNREILPVIQKAYLYPDSMRYFKYTDVWLVQNKKLLVEFNEWRKDMRREGRLEKELDESYGFFLADSERSAKEACQNGLCVGNVKTGCLGTPKMGVYLCSFSDVLQPMQLPIGTGVMLIFKMCKILIVCLVAVTQGRVQTLERPSNPSSQFDCHVSKKLAFVNSSNNDCFVHKHSQCYLFEFGELDICRRPRQVCPYAMVAFSYEGDGISVSLRDKSRPTVQNTAKVTPKRHYIVWEGQLMNKGQNLGQVTLKSMQLSVLPIALPGKIEVDNTVRNEHVMKMLPRRVFMKYLYANSKEVNVYKWYCCLFEMSSAYEYTSQPRLEALQAKLKREETMLVKFLEDGGFLLVFPPGVIVNEKSHDVESSNLKAMFVFKEPRIVIGNTGAPDTTAPDTTASDTTALDTTALDTTAMDTTAPDTTALKTPLGLKSLLTAQHQLQEEAHFHHHWKGKQSLPLVPMPCSRLRHCFEWLLRCAPAWPPPPSSLSSYQPEEVPHKRRATRVPGKALRTYLDRPDSFMIAVPTEDQMMGAGGGCVTRLGLWEAEDPDLSYLRPARKKSRFGIEARDNVGEVAMKWEMNDGGGGSLDNDDAGDLDRLAISPARERDCGEMLRWRCSEQESTRMGGDAAEYKQTDIEQLLALVLAKKMVEQNKDNIDVDGVLGLAEKAFFDHNGLVRGAYQSTLEESRVISWDGCYDFGGDWPHTQDSLELCVLRAVYGPYKPLLENELMDTWKMLLAREVLHGCNDPQDSATKEQWKDMGLAYRKTIDRDMITCNFNNKQYSAAMGFPATHEPVDDLPASSPGWKLVTLTGLRKNSLPENYVNECDPRYSHCNASTRLPDHVICFPGTGEMAFDDGPVACADFPREIPLLEEEERRRCSGDGRGGLAALPSGGPHFPHNAEGDLSLPCKPDAPSFLLASDGTPTANLADLPAPQTQDVFASMRQMVSNLWSGGVDSGVNGDTRGGVGDGHSNESEGLDDNPDGNVHSKRLLGKWVKHVKSSVTKSSVSSASTSDSDDCADFFPRFPSLLKSAPGHPILPRGPFCGWIELEEPVLSLVRSMDEIAGVAEPSIPPLDQLDRWWQQQQCRPGEVKSRLGQSRRFKKLHPVDEVADDCATMLAREMDGVCRSAGWDLRLPAGGRQAVHVPPADGVGTDADTLIYQMREQLKSGSLASKICSYLKRVQKHNWLHASAGDEQDEEDEEEESNHRTSTTAAVRSYERVSLDDSYFDRCDRRRDCGIRQEAEVVTMAVDVQDFQAGSSRREDGDASVAAWSPTVESVMWPGSPVSMDLDEDSEGCEDEADVRVTGSEVKGGGWGDLVEQRCDATLASSSVVHAHHIAKPSKTDLPWAAGICSQPDTSGRLGWYPSSVELPAPHPIGGVPPETTCLRFPHTEQPSPQLVSTARPDYITACQVVPVGIGAGSLPSTLQPEVVSADLSLGPAAAVAGQPSATQAVPGLVDQRDAFYVHGSPADPELEPIREYLRLQNWEEIQDGRLAEYETSSKRALVVIRNKDIGSILHTIPRLLQLRQASSGVRFAGVDGLADITNRSFRKLLHLGGFLVSDDTALKEAASDPGLVQKFIGVLRSLNSVGTRWVWKLHGRMVKNLHTAGRESCVWGDVLSLVLGAERQQLAEFLPPHACDDACNASLGFLGCAVSLQALSPQCRYTVFLTGNVEENVSRFHNAGIAVSTISDFIAKFHEGAFEPTHRRMAMAAANVAKQSKEREASLQHPPEPNAKTKLLNLGIQRPPISVPSEERKDAGKQGWPLVRPLPPKPPQPPQPPLPLAQERQALVAAPAALPDLKESNQTRPNFPPPAAKRVQQSEGPMSTVAVSAALQDQNVSSQFWPNVSRPEPDPQPKKVSMTASLDGKKMSSWESQPVKHDDQWLKALTAEEKEADNQNSPLVPPSIVKWEPQSTRPASVAPDVKKESGCSLISASPVPSFKQQQQQQQMRVKNQETKVASRPLSDDATKVGAQSCFLVHSTTICGERQPDPVTSTVWDETLLVVPSPSPIPRTPPRPEQQLKAATSSDKKDTEEQSSTSIRQPTIDKEQRPMVVVSSMLLDEETYGSRNSCLVTSSSSTREESPVAVTSTTSLGAKRGEGKRKCSSSTTTLSALRQEPQPRVESSASAVVKKETERSSLVEQQQQRTGALRPSGETRETMQVDGTYGGLGWYSASEKAAAPVPLEKKEDGEASSSAIHLSTDENQQRQATVVLPPSPLRSPLRAEKKSGQSSPRAHSRAGNSERLPNSAASTLTIEVDDDGSQVGRFVSPPLSPREQQIGAAASVVLAETKKEEKQRYFKSPPLVEKKERKRKWASVLSSSYKQEQQQFSQVLSKSMEEKVDGRQSKAPLLLLSTVSRELQPKAAALAAFEKRDASQRRFPILQFAIHEDEQQLPEQKTESGCTAGTEHLPRVAVCVSPEEKGKTQRGSSIAMHEECLAVVTPVSSQLWAEKPRSTQNVSCALSSSISEHGQQSKPSPQVTFENDEETGSQQRQLFLPRHDRQPSLATPVPPGDNKDNKDSSHSRLATSVHERPPAAEAAVSSSPYDKHESSETWIPVAPQQSSRKEQQQKPEALAAVMVAAPQLKAGKHNGQGDATHDSLWPSIPIPQEGNHDLAGDLAGGRKHRPVTPPNERAECKRRRTDVEEPPGPPPRVPKAESDEKRDDDGVSDTPDERKRCDEKRAISDRPTPPDVFHLRVSSFFSSGDNAKGQRGALLLQGDGQVRVGGLPDRSRLTVHPPCQSERKKNILKPLSLWEEIKLRHKQGNQHTAGMTMAAVAAHGREKPGRADGSTAKSKMGAAEMQSPAAFHRDGCTEKRTETPSGDRQHWKTPPERMRITKSSAEEESERRRRRSPGRDDSLDRGLHSSQAPHTQPWCQTGDPEQNNKDSSTTDATSASASSRCPNEEPGTTDTTAMTVLPAPPKIPPQPPLPPSCPPPPPPELPPPPPPPPECPPPKSLSPPRQPSGCALQPVLPPPPLPPLFLSQALHQGVQPCLSRPGFVLPPPPCATVPPPSCPIAPPQFEMMPPPSCPTVPPPSCPTVPPPSCSTVPPPSCPTLPPPCPTVHPNSPPPVQPPPWMFVGTAGTLPGPTAAALPPQASPAQTYQQPYHYLPHYSGPWQPPS